MTRRKKLPGSKASAAPDRATPLLRERVRGVFKRLPRALAGDEEALHDMRVAARRLRVALPLLARRPDGRRVRRSLKILQQVTRTAGASRDLDVAVSLLAGSGAEPTPELAVLKRRLRAARGRSRTRMAEALLDLEIAELRRHLRAAVSRRADGLFVVLRRLRETRTALGTEALSLLDALGDRYEPAALHRLRIRTRRLRYIAELADAFRGQSTPAAEDLKALQDRLGVVQDTHVIAEWFSRQAAAAQARGQADLAREARAQRAYFVEASHAHHRDFLAAGPAAVIRRALAAMAGSRSAA